MATKNGIARTISRQWRVKCKHHDDGSWSVNGTVVKDATAAKVFARHIDKKRGQE